MKLFCSILLVFYTLGLAGCADPNIEPVPFGLQLGQAFVLGPNLRTVSERPRAIPYGGVLPTVCSEPSPDAAIAFGKSLAVAANITQPSGPSGGGSLNAASTELATDLGGRSAGVLALRDGLSEACRAYVNGAIGQDAYALILSQYGGLLVALAGTGTSGSAPPRFTAQEAALTALLVGCISEHDPTRLGGNRTNPLLSQPRCEKLLDSIAAGRILKPVAERPAVKPTGTKAAETRGDMPNPG